jgi:hypothetical protein
MEKGAAAVYEADVSAVERDRRLDRVGSFTT